MVEIKLANLAATEAWGLKLGQALQANDCLVLTGELGTGKTTLTKGIAQGLAITQLIKSPTYTIAREYRQGRLPLFHLDVYRLADSDGDDLGLTDYYEQGGVTVIEWGQLLGVDLPASYLEIKLFYSENSDERRAELVSVGAAAEALLARIMN